MPKYLVTLFIAAGILIIYFFLLRPVRADINENILLPIIEHSVNNGSNTSIGYEAGSRVSTRIFWGEVSSLNEFYIAVPFGLQFLIGMLGLVSIRADKKYYLALVIIQVVGGILTVSFFYLGALYLKYLLICADLTIRYLTPLCSLGTVPLAFIQKRQQLHEARA
ncbi:MAG: hypothetical protein WD016_02020 [Balneolaceae bacterium]